MTSAGSERGYPGILHHTVGGRADQRAAGGIKLSPSHRSRPCDFDAPEPAPLTRYFPACGRAEQKARHRVAWSSPLGHAPRHFPPLCAPPRPPTHPHPAKNEIS